MSLEQALNANTQAIYALLEHMRANVGAATPILPPAPTVAEVKAPAPVIETVSPTPVAEPEPAPASTVDRAQVQHALLTVAKNKGKPAAVAVLEGFGVKGLADLPEAKYSDCLNALNKVLEQDVAA